jgi:hypothetical protein
MGTFCPDLSGNHTTVYYSSRQNASLSTIFHVIRECFCTLGHNSKFLRHSSLLLKVYHTSLLLTTTLNNTVRWEVASC